MCSKYLLQLYRPDFKLGVPWKRPSHVFGEGILIGASSTPPGSSLTPPGYPYPSLSSSLLTMGYLISILFSIHLQLPQTNILTP